MNNIINKCILSYADIQTIRLIMKCLAEKDVKGLAALPMVKESDDRYFWPSLNGCGIEFDEPPDDFFILWYMQFGQQKNILSLEGPMWEKNVGASNWYLYLEKYIEADPPYIFIKGYGST